MFDVPVQVDSALADAGPGSDVLDGDPPVPEAQQQLASGI
jgi:hypothetical protein